MDQSVGLLPLFKALLPVASDPEIGPFFQSIYSDESVVVTVFRLLTDFERNLIFKLLLIDRPITEQLLSHWIVQKPSGESPVLRLISIGVIAKMEDSLLLHSHFRSTLISSISNRSQQTSIDAPTTSQVWELRNLNELRSIFGGFKKHVVPTVGETKWHSLLDRIISSAPATSEKDIDKIILRLGFATSPTPPSAFKFVLSDISSQLWTLISEFVNVICRGHPSVASDIFKVICGIVANNEAKALSLVRTDSIIVRTVLFLEDLDIIRSTGDGTYILGPTAPALHGSATSSGASDVLIGAQLIVDSNMHITAYTKSNLQVKLISLFCQVHRIMGTVLVGTLTRASVQRAVDQGGVAADSIIQFLSSNLHPVCGGSIPPNVANQIRLWEADCPRNRLRMEACVTFTWPADRSEQASSSIKTVRLLAETHKGLLFTKQEPDGRVLVGVKASIAQSYILGEK